MFHSLGSVKQGVIKIGVDVYHNHRVWLIFLKGCYESLCHWFILLNLILGKVGTLLSLLIKEGGWGLQKLAETGFVGLSILKIGRWQEGGFGKRGWMPHFLLKCKADIATLKLLVTLKLIESLN